MSEFVYLFRSTPEGQRGRWARRSAHREPQGVARLDPRARGEGAPQEPRPAARAPGKSCAAGRRSSPTAPTSRRKTWSSASSSSRRATSRRRPSSRRLPDARGRRLVEIRPVKSPCSTPSTRIIATMRRIIAFNRVSADGYFADPKGDLNWAVQDPELDRGAGAGDGRWPPRHVPVRAATYELFEGFWPHALDARILRPTRRPAPAGQRSAEHARHRDLDHEATKIVFSQITKGRDLEELAARPRLRPTRNRGHEAGARQGHDDLRQRIDRVAAHGARPDRRVPVHRQPTPARRGRPLDQRRCSQTALDAVEATASRPGNVMLRYARASCRSDG